MKYTRKFSDVSKNDIGIFGGKAASLGEMLQAGVPVPDGFAISTDAYLAFRGKNFTKEFRNELHDMYKSLGSTRVAVRSSAVAEDSDSASWAGQLETYLNTTEEDLETAVRSCWKSVESDNVQSYTKGKNLVKKDFYVGVAVQKMVDSEKAGVMFTVNPITSNRGEIIIESAYGLGEMVVQGTVTPDRFVVDKNNLSVKEYEVSVKEKMMKYIDGKNKVIEVPGSIADRTSLWDDDIFRLAEMGVKIEKHYKQPMDIEWAMLKGELFIVQARPITTLKIS